MIKFANLAEDYCEKCGNSGILILRNENNVFYNKPCSCTEKKKTLQDIEAMRNKELPQEVLDEYVPSPYYQNNYFDTDTFMEAKNLPIELTDIRYTTYLNFSDGLTKLFQSGELPTKSYMIAAPSNFAKNVFMYSSIQILLKANKKPSPLIYISDIVDDVKEKGMKLLDNLFREYDIVFVTLGVSPRIRDIILFTQLLEKANHWGKPVISSSRKHPFELSSYYPNIMEFFEQDTSEKYKYNRTTVTGLDYDYFILYENYIRSQSLNNSNERTNYNQHNNGRNNYSKQPQNIQYGFPPNQQEKTLSVAQMKEKIRNGENN